MPTGTGSFLRGFRIGSAQWTDSQSSNLGSAYDTGIDPGTAAGVISQNEAFTCNLVAAAIVQCVKGPTYANGLFSIIGQWSSRATFASYGDPNNAFSFTSGLIGYPGGQAFPVMAGSGYSPAGNYVTGGNCTLTVAAGQTPMAPAMGFTVSRVAQSSTHTQLRLAMRSTSSAASRSPSRSPRHRLRPGRAMSIWSSALVSRPGATRSFPARF